MTEPTTLREKIEQLKRFQITLRLYEDGRLIERMLICVELDRVLALLTAIPSEEASGVSEAQPLVSCEGCGEMVQPNKPHSTCVVAHPCAEKGEFGGVSEAPPFKVVQCKEWQCRYVFPTSEQECCRLALNHTGPHDRRAGSSGRSRVSEAPRRESDEALARLRAWAITQQGSNSPFVDRHLVADILLASGHGKDGR
jgi:hypothetical protein